MCLWFFFFIFYVQLYCELIFHSVADCYPAREIDLLQHIKVMKKKQSCCSSTYAKASTFLKNVLRAGSHSALKLSSEDCIYECLKVGASDGEQRKSAHLAPSALLHREFNGRLKADGCFRAAAPRDRKNKVCHLSLSLYACGNSRLSNHCSSVYFRW